MRIEDLIIPLLIVSGLSFSAGYVRGTAEGANAVATLRSWQRLVRGLPRTGESLVTFVVTFVGVITSIIETMHKSTEH